MLCQINLGEVALSEQAEELVIAKVLSHTVSHVLTLFRAEKGRMLEGLG
jgi:hypothetical protein